MNLDSIKGHVTTTLNQIKTGYDKMTSDSAQVKQFKSVVAKTALIGLATLIGVSLFAPVAAGLVVAGVVSAAAFAGFCYKHTPVVPVLPNSNSAQKTT